jgi:hypothetical protein
MLILFFLICVALIVLDGILDWDDFGRAFGVFLGCIVIIVTCVLGTILYKLDHTATAKITYLEQNNLEIETKLSTAIATYQAYEKDAYASFKPETGSDITVAISLYPDLKSDAMVVSLLETYRSNNDDIRALKLQQLDRPTYAFWLYFGGGSAPQ